MKAILLALVVLAALLIIASGVWVAAALIRAIMPARRAEPPTSRRSANHKPGTETAG